MTRIDFRTGQAPLAVQSDDLVTIANGWIHVYEKPYDQRPPEQSPKISINHATVSRILWGDEPA